MRCSLARAGGHGTVRLMRQLLILAIHSSAPLAKLLRPSGVRRCSRLACRFRRRIDGSTPAQRAGASHPHLFLPRSIVTLGGDIAAVYCRLQLPRNWEFATHRRAGRGAVPAAGDAVPSGSPQRFGRWLQQRPLGPIVHKAYIENNRACGSGLFGDATASISGTPMCRRPCVR